MAQEDHMETTPAALRDLQQKTVSQRTTHLSASVVRKKNFLLTPYEGGKVQDQNGDVWTPAEKSYKNLGFLSSRSARLIRIMAEYEETATRLEEHNVHHTILVFCSARGKKREDWEVLKAEADVKVAAAKQANDKAQIDKAEANLLRINRLEWMCEYYDKTRELTRRLAEWSSQQEVKFHISSGGGPGLMEAANEGAFLSGQPTVGMGISVPFEPGLNKFVSNELAFEYHYFFTRKFWMSYTARALIVSPGGFGTCDELFELLTLQQTRKMHDTPVVCLGVDFWNDVLNIEKMVEYGTVSPRDAERIFFTDSVDEAFDHVVAGLNKFVETEFQPLHPEDH